MVVSIDQWRCVGATAAFVAALTYVFGFVVLVWWIGPIGLLDDQISPSDQMALIDRHVLPLATWYFVVYIVNGTFLAVLAVALYRRLCIQAPGVAVLILLFGGLWAVLVIAAGLVATTGVEAATNRCRDDAVGCYQLWVTIKTIVNGLGGGNEIVGGIWYFLLGLVLPGEPLRAVYLGRFSVLLGVVGIASTWPAWSDHAGALFGLAGIVWFAWVGCMLLQVNDTAGQ